MKICPDHWHDLRNAIRQRGLWGLVAPSGYLERQVTEQELAATATLDPLKATSLMISDQAVMALGPYLLTCNDCPLCELDRSLGRGLSLEWIEFDADMILQVCQERHMIGHEQ
jgi:hypothetical protein